MFSSRLNTSCPPFRLFHMPACNGACTHTHTQYGICIKGLQRLTLLTCLLLHQINTTSIHFWCFCRWEFADAFCCSASRLQTVKTPNPDPPSGKMVRLSRAVLEGWKAKSCRSKPKKYSKEDLLAAPHSTQFAVSWHTLPLWPSVWESCANPPRKNMLQ